MKLENEAINKKLITEIKFLQNQFMGSYLE